MTESKGMLFFSATIIVLLDLVTNVFEQGAFRGILS